MADSFDFDALLDAARLRALELYAQALPKLEA